MLGMLGPVVVVLSVISLIVVSGGVGYDRACTYRVSPVVARVFHAAHGENLAEWLCAANAWYARPLWLWFVFVLYLVVVLDGIGYDSERNKMVALSVWYTLGLWFVFVILSGILFWMALSMTENLAKWLHCLLWYILWLWFVFIMYVVFVSDCIGCDKSFYI